MSIQHLAGQKLGQYELREMMGLGGMGAVYRGYQKSLKRAVAVKVLSPQLAQQAGYLERFNREAETAAALEHRHIIPIYDYGTQNGISYVVMRLLSGGTLADRLKLHTEENKPLPSLSEIAEVLAQIAGALDYAHIKGVIHRDIKPSNIMFDDQGSSYVVDFGIAKLVEATQALTGPGMTMGTPLYMSPEQWRAEELTAAADQYAVGVMIYALVTGRPPFEAATPFALMHKHLNEVPTPPQMFRHDVPQAVTEALRRAMAKNAADRFPSVTDFAQAFTNAIAGLPGVTTGFFTTPVPAPPPLGATAVSGAVDMQGATYTPATDASAAQPAYRSPVVWGLVAIIAALIGIVGFLQFGSGGSGSGTPVTESQAQIGTALRQTIIALMPTDEVTNTPTQTQAPSLEPTATDMPTDTLAPTATPEPSATDTPTDTLAPTATPEPTTTDTPTFQPTVTSSPTSTRPNAIILRVMVYELNVRAGPGLNFSVLGAITLNETYDVTGTTADYTWIMIDYQGERGWVSSGLVDITQGELGAAPVIPPPYDGSVPTETPSPTATATPEPTPTETLSPTATDTPEPTPTPTDTPEPTSTETPSPTTTDTPEPTPTPTDTPEPTATDTPSPTSTVTPEPTSTDTPSPTRTDTPSPTSTVTPQPTATDTPSSTPTATPSRTPEPTPTLTACQLADLNGNGAVDILDIRIISAAYGAAAGSDRYRDAYDLDDNNRIDVLDLRRITSQFGQTCP